MLDVVGDGAGREHEAPGDLLIREPLGNQGRDLPLASRQDLDRLARRRAQARLGRPSGHVLRVQRMEADPEDILAWLAALRRRVERGELAALGPYETEDGVLGMDLTARIMLADLDHYRDLSPEQRHDPAVIARHVSLLEDFRRLRAQIG